MTHDISWHLGQISLSAKRLCGSKLCGLSLKPSWKTDILAHFCTRRCLKQQLCLSPAFDSTLVWTNSSRRQHLDVFCIKSRDVRTFCVPHLSSLHFVAVCLIAEYTNDKMDTNGLMPELGSVAYIIKTVQLQSTRSLSAFKICFRSFDEAFASGQSMEVGKWYKIQTISMHP